MWYPKLIMDNYVKQTVASRTSAAFDSFEIIFGYSFVSFEGSHNNNLVNFLVFKYSDIVCFLP